MMRPTQPYVAVDGRWLPVQTHTYAGGWRQVDTNIPVNHIHREDPIPYAMPTTAPWNVPVTCPIPTYDGSNKTLHPAVVDFHHEFGPGGTFRGYRYWMAHTPYPQENILLENPCIVASNNGWDWRDPYGITNPVVPQPEPDTYYNADPDLAWNPDLERFELIWKHRELYGDKDVYYRHSYSHDGITWSESTIITATEGSSAPSAAWGSPGMARTGPDQWKIVFAGPSGTLATYTAANPAGPYTGPIYGEITGTSFIDGEFIWHPDVLFDGESWWMLTSTRGTRAWIYPARSANGVDWVFGPAVLEDIPNDPTRDSFKYRPTFVLHENGTDMRVWYSERGTVSVRYTHIPLTEWPEL